MKEGLREKKNYHTFFILLAENWSVINPGELNV